MKTVLCFGDSNTFGLPPMENLNSEGRFDANTRWPCVMTGELGDAWVVIEAGHPGRTTVHDDPIEGENRNGSRMIEMVIQSHRPIDLLIIMLGVNDHKQRFGVGAQDIALGAGKLVALAQKSGFVEEILLVSPPKVLERGCLAPMFAGAEARGAGLAGYMQNAAIDAGVGFFDAASVVAFDPLDGVHLSAESHVVLGKAIANTNVFDRN